MLIAAIGYASQEINATINQTNFLLTFLSIT